MTPLHSSTYEYPLDTNRHFCRSVDQYMAAQISCLYDYHTHHEEAQASQNALDEDPALAYETGASLSVEPCQMKRSRHVRFLWGAVMANLEEIYDEERKRREAFHGRRGGCVCAAEGCGIRAEGGATLRACSGRCPRDLKPRYCSKTCQKKDWPGHKTVCKAGSVRKAPVITDKAGALVFFELGEDHQDAEDVEAAAHFR